MSCESQSNDFKFSDKPTMDELRLEHIKFIIDRNWEQYQTPRNLVLALVGEIGELCELFQWKEGSAGDPNNWTDEQRNHLEQEISDIYIYLIALANRCKVDLPKCVIEKMALNEKKYPIEKAFGSSKKYNEL